MCRVISLPQNILIYINFAFKSKTSKSSDKLMRFLEMPFCSVYLSNNHLLFKKLLIVKFDPNNVSTEKYLQLPGIKLQRPLKALYTDFVVFNLF